MFRKSSKIVVIESSATKRAHPAVGDIGYINDMHLFYKDRFILLDAFFFRYKSDIRNNKTRCERKKFILDLGMHKTLRHKLKTYGAKRKFLINNKHSVNLTACAYYVDPVGALVEAPDILSIYPNIGAGITPIIPYGRISLAPDSRKPIHSEGSNALLCWLKCLLPAFGINKNPRFTEKIDPEYLSVGGISKIIHKRSLDKYSLDIIAPYNCAIPRITGLPASDHHLHIIDDMRIIQALSKFVLRGCDTAALKTLSVIDKLNFSTTLTGTNNCLTMRGKLSYRKHKILASMLLRSMLMSKNTKSSLFGLLQNGILPAGLDGKNLVNELEDIKIRANSSSAALNRIFELSILR